MALIACYSFIFRRTSPPVFRFIYTLVSVAIFALFYRINFTVEMAAAFLMLSASLKLLEIKSKRDAYLLVFVMLYLSAVSFLFDQRFLHTILQFVILVFCFSILLTLNVSAGVSAFKSQWRSILKLFAFALPLVIVCFLFFPRIAPLWSIPIDTKGGASTGISEFMSPGDIAELSQSSERAFRVEFSGEVPDQPDLYWRGLVLDYFDGREWRKSNLGQYVIPKKVDLGRFYDLDGDSYEVMLEPHQNRWLFALEGSSPSSSNVVSGDMGLFELKTDAIQAARYKMQYLPETKRVDILPTGKTLRGKARKSKFSKKDLQLPRAGNQRTQRYVQQMQARYPTELGLAQALLKQFSQREFFYTLKPPKLGRDFVDEFLFDSQRGFCAHYSGSLAYMLRLAGIPARVIVGYQGGEFNADQNYLIVHQYDAHAWVEAYFDEFGWVRLDPTALVAPDRVDYSLQEAVREEGTFLEDNPLIATAMGVSALNWMRLRLDEMNFRWQKWVVNYGEGQQVSIVKALMGEYSLSRIIWLFVITSIVVVTVVYAYFWRSMHRLELTKSQRKYLRWLAVMKRFGYVRSVGESPSDFLARVEQGNHPRLLRMTARITKELERADYQ